MFNGRELITKKIYLHKNRIAPHRVDVIIKNIYHKSNEADAIFYI